MRRVAVAALGALLAVALAACGTNTPDPTTPSQTSGLTGDGTLGEGPAGSATPTATTPSGPSLPAPHSSKPNKSGYVWVDQAAASYNPSTDYQFNSTGGTISVFHSGPGNYVVGFAGLGTGGGVAHAQAYGPTANYCTVAGWNPTGDVAEVRVTCFAAGGAPADTQFVASFAEGSMGNSRFSYLWADNASATAKYQPDESYRYDAVDANLTTVTRTATGRYEVYLPAAGDLGNTPWTFQVTAYGSNNLCKLTSFNSSSRKALVACRTPGGSLANSRFSLTFASGASVIGRTDRSFNAFSEDSDGLATSSAGVYEVSAPDLGSDKGHVVVLSRGTSSTYCHVSSWYANGSDLKANAVCFNPGGTPANSSFEMAITL